VINIDNINNVELQVDKVNDSKWIKNSGIYTTEIEMAYMMESKGGAKGISLHFVTEKGEKYNKDIYMTNKKGSPYYIDKQTKEQRLLPGANDVIKYCELITGKRDAYNVTEDTIYPVWDKESKGEIDKTVSSVVPLIGKIVQLALRETVEDKTALNSGSGNWEPTGDTKIVIEIAAMLDGVTGKTLGEKTAGLESTYKDKFLNKIAEDPIFVPKKVVGTLPPGVSGGSGQVKPKVNADTTAGAGDAGSPFGG